MAKWADAGETKMGLVTKLFEEGSKSDKALQLLLPVYCQRIDLWHECLPMLAYASLRSEAEQYFKDLECDPKRSAFYFSLTRWTPLERDNANCWPLQVMVRQQFDVSDDERFVVLSSLYLPEVAERHQDDICATANAMRSVHLTRKKKLEAGQRRATLRFDYCKSEQSAAKLLADQLSDLDKRFSPIALAA
jgi:hypothetical protein